MAKNFSGRDLLFYASTSSPGTATDASAYTLVGNVTSTSLSRSRNALDKSSKDDGDNSTFIAGRRNQTVSVSGNFDHTEEAGYTVLSDAYEAADGLVYWLISSTTTGDTEWHGSGPITQLDLSFDDEAISTFSCSIQSSGAVTEVAGTST